MNYTSWLGSRFQQIKCYISASKKIECKNKMKCRIYLTSWTLMPRNYMRNQSFRLVMNLSKSGADWSDISQFCDPFHMKKKVLSTLCNFSEILDDGNVNAVQVCTECSIFCRDGTEPPRYPGGEGSPPQYDRGGGCFCATFAMNECKINTDCAVCVDRCVPWTNLGGQNTFALSIRWRPTSPRPCMHDGVRIIARLKHTNFAVKKSNC
jgi:hypothetical protein